jgi:outer membrane biosynthesis protein TonB
MRTRGIFVAIALAAATLTACGSNGVDLAPRAQRQLQASVDDVRTAVAAADRLGARSALRELERSVDQLVADGLISDTRAAEIISAAEDVATQLSLLPAPEPSPSPSPEPTKTEKPPKPKPEPKPEPKPKPKPHDPGHDEGH